MKVIFKNADFSENGIGSITPENLSYIESDGESMINLGISLYKITPSVKPNVEDYIEIKFALSDSSMNIQSLLLGDAQTTSVNYSNRKIQFTGIQSFSQTEYFKDNIDSEFHTLHIGTFNMKFDNEIFYSNTDQQYRIQAYDVPYILFGGINRFEANIGGIRVKKITFCKDGNIIANFIPQLYDKEPCLYDTINKNRVFNSGNGSLLYG